MNLRTSLGTPTWTERDFLTDKEQAKALWNGVLEDTGHPLLVDFLATLIEVANVPERDNRSLARALQLYSARQIKFVRERPERFASAMRTIAWGMGDCDDKSRFIAASLRTFRVPARLHFIRYMATQANGKPIRSGHVWPEALLNNVWTPLESVREVPLGLNPIDKVKKLGAIVDEQIVGDES